MRSDAHSDERPRRVRPIQLGGGAFRQMIIGVVGLGAMGLGIAQVYAPRDLQSLDDLEVAAGFHQERLLAVALEREIPLDQVRVVRRADVGEHGIPGRRKRRGRAAPLAVEVGAVFEGDGGVRVDQ